MILPKPTTEAERLTYALGHALLTAGTDEKAKTLTVHRAAAIEACLTMAAGLANLTVDGATRQPAAAVSKQITTQLAEFFADVDKNVTRRTLVSSRPGFTLRTLA